MLFTLRDQRDLTPRSNSLLDRGVVIVILRKSHNYNYGLFFKTLMAFL